MTHLYQPTAAEIAAVTESMTVAYTGDKDRIARAAALISAGHVSYVSAGIGWQVLSQQAPAAFEPGSENEIDEVVPQVGFYHVTSQSCGCYDFLNRISAQGRCADQQVKVHAGCKHVWAVRMYIRIISAKLDEAMKAPFSGVYGIETRTSNLFAVMDRLTDVAICGCIYDRTTDRYKPEKGTDAAEFSKWLFAQPQEFFPGGMLEQILRNAPGDAVTLRATVIYTTPRTYTLEGYQYEGKGPVSLEYNDRQHFNDASWFNQLQAFGFIMPGRPEKGHNYNYYYTLKRGTNAEPHFGLGAATEHHMAEKRLRDMLERDLETNS